MLTAYSFFEANCAITLNVILAWHFDLILCFLGELVHFFYYDKVPNMHLSCQTINMFLI